MSRLMARGPLVPAAIACLVVGAVLMILFEQAVTRALGVVLLAAWIVLGLLAVASPDDLARADDGEDGRGG